MNKFIKLLFVTFIFYFFVIIGVNALESDTKLHVSSEASSATTDTFTYNNVGYVYDQNSDTSLFNFESIFIRFLSFKLHL